ncbi:ROK family protein [Spiroplasma cantharicola]|uniref:Transcriptional regulator/sugar kinase n=1 Tax=Spiroplasma cantharicola TaxID=362837 RepID=A0A0M5KCD9_9MOLU|nr:ROK family protein [Spiroplasma cantharicola]ALD66481.1 transcriptional regulator/sugar kinase [Spiroplasma cantharicola]
MKNTNYLYDIGGLSIKKIIIDDNQKILSEGVIEYDNQKRANAWQLDANYVFELIKRDLPRDIKINLGISIPGIIDSKKYKILSESSLTNIKEINLKDFFAEFKNIETFEIENDAKSAAYGEYYFGQNKKYKNMLHVTVGTGLGGGIIINGKIYKGFKGGAGELSKLFANFDRPDINLIVQSTSTGANLKRYNDSIELGKVAPIENVITAKAKDSAKKKNLIDGKKFMSLVEKNDQMAVDIFDIWTTSLTKYLVSLNFLMDFDAITIGGGISSNSKFLDTIIQKAKNYILLFQNFSPIENINIIKSNLENKAGCFGVLAKILKS